MSHWLIDTPGIGALVAVGVALSVCACYVRLVRWIQVAPRDRRGGGNGPAKGGQA